MARVGRGVRPLRFKAAALSLHRAKSGLKTVDQKPLLLEASFRKAASGGWDEVGGHQQSSQRTSPDRYHWLIRVGAPGLARSRCPSVLSVPREHNLTRTTVKKKSVSSGSNSVPLINCRLSYAREHLDFHLIIFDVLRAKVVGAVSIAYRTFEE